MNAPREKVAELTTLSTQQAEDINVYESKQRSYETERRQLHNTIQELKGNIRVFCRIRPLLGAEIEKHGGQFNHIIVQVNFQFIDTQNHVFIVRSTFVVLKKRDEK